MVLRGAHIKLRVAGVTVCLVRFRRTPFVMAEMGLGKTNEHADVVCSAQEFREGEVRARFATVVVGVNVIDAESLDSLKCLASGIVGGKGCADLRVVQRNG